MKVPQTTRANDSVKRTFDLMVAVPAYVASLPVQAVVAVLVRRNLGRPILFRQRRPGLNGQIFTLVKFRTMKDRDVESGLITDADRLTRLGRTLRSTSLDELPTLLNVIKGEMSLVGPRPLLPEYLDRYTAEQARRHEVRPGVTGLAQVSGRNAISWDEKLQLDVRYVDEHNFLMDLKLIAATFGTVVRRSGVSASGQATMDEFQGSSVHRRSE